VNIDKRPAIVEGVSRMGDWEGDTIIGKGRKNTLLTMVERKTLYTVMIMLTNKRADLPAETAIKELEPLKDKVNTITLDNGLKSSAHESIAERLEANTDFAHPYASWERGDNENLNGLIRQYFPKGTDFNDVNDDKIEFVMNRFNNQPRAPRGGRTPNE
jgi:IS30 family transposase